MNKTHLAEQNRKKLAMVYVLMASGVTKDQVEKKVKQLFAPKSQSQSTSENPFWRSRTSKSFYDPHVGFNLKTWAFSNAP